MAVAPFVSFISFTKRLNISDLQLRYRENEPAAVKPHKALTAPNRVAEL
jgi:hypothetical protein